MRKQCKTVSALFLCLELVYANWSFEGMFFSYVYVVFSCKIICLIAPFNNHDAYFY